MDPIAHQPLSLSEDEWKVMTELLESERAKLLIEIRHTHHRDFRDELRERLRVIEDLLERCPTVLRRLAG